MYWLFLTMLAIGSRATFSLASKVLANQLRHVSPGTQNALLTGVAAIFSVVLSPLLGGLSSRGMAGHWLEIIVLVLCASFGGLTFFMGQKHLDAGTAQIAFSSILLWGVIFSIIILGSRFSGMQGVGIVVLFAAIILTQYRKGKRRLDPGIAWIIVSAALFAGMQVASADLSKQMTIATYLLVVYAGPTVVLTLCGMHRMRCELPHLLRLDMNMLKAVLFAAMTSFGYYAFSYVAYRHAPDAGVVVVLLTSQVVVSVILGVIFMRERQEVPRKIVAGALAFVAGLFIKIG